MGAAQILPVRIGTEAAQNYSVRIGPVGPDGKPPARPSRFGHTPPVGTRGTIRARLRCSRVRGCAYAEANQQSYILRLCGADRSARDRLLDALSARGVATRRGLMAVHLEEPYRETRQIPQARRGGSLRESELADSQTFLLPVFPALSQEDQDYVVSCLGEVLEELGPMDGSRQ